MMNVIRRTGTTCGAMIVLATISAAASAQAPAAPPTAFDRQLERIDLGVSGKGEFTKTTTGTNYLAQTVSLLPSNTLGALVTLRYTKSPLVGLEFNYGYARYTENFTISNLSNTTPGAAPLALGVQTNVSEYTFGYVVHARHDYFGVRPFASIGAGSMAFRPTTGGGQGLLPQARAAYYYSVGAEAPISKHFGLRGTFRQSLFNAPDFESNYFANKQRTISTEPAFGFFIRF
jgi:hypothetical protein